MFSQACVKISVRGGGAYVGYTPPDMHSPQACTPPGMHAPPWILRDLVNERVVHIILECILVTTCNEVGARLCFYTRGCHFVHRGGVCLSACWDTTNPPQEQTPSSPPPPGSRHPPGAVHAGRYGQQAGVRILLECILV